MIELITDPTNLYLAWQKLKKALQPGDIWFDPIELANFEANLEKEFTQIRLSIRSNNYSLTPILPIGYPKAKRDEEFQTRQTFNISVRDQLVWIAIVNIIGPELDSKMPFWSFGNRLFRSVWYEDKAGSENKEIKFGWYRHSSGFIYRKWNQSWPRYRRNISITTRVMAHNNLFKNDIDKFKEQHISDSQEIAELEQNDLLPNELKVKYWKKEFWTKELSGDVFWASIDLKKFYPSIKLQIVFDSILKHLSKEKRSVDFQNLLKKVLDFQINKDGWSEPDLKEIELNDSGDVYTNIPTGLLVAGFLANVAMLDVDLSVDKEIDNLKSFSHFRFVDDHVVLASSFEELETWINKYKEILYKFLPGVIINLKKTEPEALKEYLNADNENKASKKKAAEKDTKLDPAFPSPLMTQTLLKVSNISKMEFDLLDEQEEDDLIIDLEHLLLADIPDQELRKDTRISFAATMLSRLVPRKISDNTKLYSQELSSFHNRLNIDKLYANILELKVESESFKNANVELDNLIKESEQFDVEILKEKEKLKQEKQKLQKHVLSLLTKAVRENHSKVRLWTRLIEYIFNTGIGSLTQVFEEVGKLKNKEATELSCEFIYTLIFQVLSEKQIRAGLIISNSNESIIKQSAAIDFVLNSIKSDFVSKVDEIEKNAKKLYLKKSIALFKIAQSSACNWIISHSEKQDHLELKFLEKINAFSKNEPFTKTLVSLSNSVDYNISNIYWWLIRKTLDEYSYSANLFWYDAIRNIPLSDSTSWSIIALFPSYIPPSLREEIPNYPQHTAIYTNNKGWEFELNSQVNELDDLPNINNSKITLYEWCIWTKRHFKETLISKTSAKNLFDPRLSEWTALKIIFQLADKLEMQVNSADSIFDIFDNKTNIYDSVHPSNYTLPSSWLKETFSSWKDWEMKIEGGLELKPTAEFISDFRYTPSTDYLDRQHAQIQGLCTILLGLLNRDFRMPFIWNVQGQKLASLSIAAKKMQGISISSITYAIIESCFSLRNIDTFFVKRTQNELMLSGNISDDTTNDIPAIQNLKDFKKRLKNAIDVLESYQISVQDNLPRQLIPINLKQYSRSSNKFLEQDENQNEGGVL